MTATISDFRARFPEFSDNSEYPDPRIQLFLDDATLDIGTDEGRWCNYYNVAQSYLAAHLLTVGTKTEVGGSSASSGPISSKSAGGVSVSYSVTTNNNRSTLDDFYMSTSYGQRFITLRNRCFVGVMVANAL